jgi:hypothetical protein
MSFDLRKRISESLDIFKRVTDFGKGIGDVFINVG